ncbi:autotransporter outer membrane beta-barrel domain-containing protein [Bacillus subtilis subsp. subtilis]|nr:autotransporter outer membrane beta-barrel domain-containing protein [Bacillus subtilis subsp. subtilis]
MMLPTALASALMLSMAVPAHAGVVNNGASYTVVAGDARDFWTVLGSSTLTVAPGAVTDTIDVSGQSRLFMNGAVTTGDDGVALRNASAVIAGGSQITAAFGPGLQMGVLLNDPSLPPPTALVEDSRIIGSNYSGATVNGYGSLVLRRSQLQGAAFGGLEIFAGQASIEEGSVVLGGDHGVIVSSDQLAGFTHTPSVLTVDASRVEGTTGNAIAVNGDYNNDVDVDIILRNGAELVAGNGVLINVQSSATPGFATHADIDVASSSLVGDIVAGAGTTASLTLADNARLQGGVTGAVALSVAQGGQWQLAKDSSVASLALGSGGTVALGDGSAFHTLTVAGDLDATGGTLLFNTVLAGDSGASDRLHVTGNTSGTGLIAVNNVGGAGAQTVEGIRLIQVDGTSAAQFSLAGRAVGGQYEYFLHQGAVSAPGDGGWYLRSRLPAVVDPCVADPTLPQCDPGPGPGPGPDPDPDPVLRPEPGAYLANQAAAVRMFQQRRHDRGEPAFEHDRVGAWVRVSRDQLQATVAGQVDARSQTSALQVGSDVWRWGQDGRGQLGVMLATGEATTQATSRLTDYGTRGRVKGNAVGVYGTWLQQPGDSTGWYVDGWLQYGRYDSHVQGDGLARETYDATTRAASLEAGYGLALISGERSTIYLQPQVQVTYTDYRGDTLQEVNGTVVQDGSAGGLESRVGVRLFGHDTAAGNRVQPFAGLNWLYNARGDSMRFDGQTLDARLPTNRYEAQAGVQLRLGQRWSAWGDLRVQRGDGGYQDAGAQLGVRRAW